MFQKFETAVVEFLAIPIDFREKAIKAGLVCNLCEFSVDATNGLVGGYEETGEIFSEMTTLRFVGKKVSKIVQGILNDFRVLNDAGHTSLLKGGPTGDSLLIVYKNVQKCQLEALFAKPQLELTPFPSIPRLSIPSERVITTIAARSCSPGKKG